MTQHYPPLPILTPDRTAQMIATALSFPQEKRRAGWSALFQHTLSLSFLGGLPLRAGFAVAATIVIVAAVTLTMPASLSISSFEMDSAVTDVNDMLLYSTIDAAI